jgi:hypothetical protein
VSSTSSLKPQEEPSRSSKIDLRNASAISRFGELPADPAAESALKSLLHHSPVSRLARAMQRVVTGVKAADPRVLTMQAGWWSRFTGAALERTVSYQRAHQQLDRQLDAANEIAAEVNDLLDRLRYVLQSKHEGIAYLDECLEVGHRALEQYDPRATGEEIPPTTMDRLSRRLTNLATLRTSLQLTQSQLNLSIESATALLDRFYEVRDVLVPVWRQHTLSLLTNADRDAERTAAALQAHDQLMQSLSKAVALAA